MSFLGIEPGRGARYALDKLLRSRADDDRFAKYMLDNGTWFQGRRLPDKYESLRGPYSKCHTNSLTLALNFPDAFHYWTGMYSVAPRSGVGTLWVAHSWLTDDSGQVVEVTFPTHDPPGSGFLSEAGEGSAIPWLPPEHWAYVGCEFDPQFVDDFFHHWGLPVFDPPPRSGLEGFERLMAVPYSKRPFDPNA